MRLVRTMCTSVILLTLVFSACALGVVPTWLCCQAVVEGAADRDDRCPHATATGAACPLHESGAAADSTCPTVQPCGSDELLQVLLTLTGALPEPRQRSEIRLAVAAGSASTSLSTDGLLLTPPAPPPRV